METCDTVLAHISMALDGEPLSDADKATIKAHLAGCPECRLMVQQMGQLDTMLRQAPLKYAPLDFTARTVEAAYAVEQQRNAWLGGGALLLCLVLFGSLLVTGQRDLFWAALTTALAPGFSGTRWLQGAIESGITLTGVLVSALLGPLFIPVTLPLLMILVTFALLQWRVWRRVHSTL